MQLWAVLFLLTTASTLYMFRAISAPIIRSTKDCSSSHWCVSWVRMMYNPTQLWNSVVDRPWTSSLDIHHPDPWHTPVAATTVFSTPDDGSRKRPKHVECNLTFFWPCIMNWLYINYQLDTLIITYMNFMYTQTLCLNIRHTLTLF